MTKKALKIAGWCLGGVLLLVLLNARLDTEPINTILNMAFAAFLLCALAFGLYTTARETALKEYRKLSLPVLATYILFFWVGGTALGAAALVGLIRGGALDLRLWVFLFVVMLISSLLGVGVGIREKQSGSETEN